MPQTTRDLNRQPMAQLARQHDKLPAMMALMRHKICQDMRYVEWKITPGVGRRRWDYATAIKAELQQANHAAATLTQGSNQLFLHYLVSIYGSRHYDAMILA